MRPAGLSALIGGRQRFSLLKGALIASAEAFFFRDNSLCCTCSSVAGAVAGVRFIYRIISFISGTWPPQQLVKHVSS